jgi:GntR family transcriptional regulator
MEFTVDKSSPIPLYHQLAEQLRSYIASGVLAPGEKLPSEISISEQIGISRMTVRQAIASLVREGLLEVRQGLGTFVAQPKFLYDATRLFGFSEEMERLGIRVTSRILQQGIVSPPSGVMKALCLSPEEQAFHVMRVRFADEQPLLIETNYVPVRLCPGIERYDFEHSSLYHCLQVDYGIRLAYARHTLEAVAATAEEANLLGVAAGSPLMLNRGVTFSDEEKPVEYFKVLYRGDRFRFEVESRRVSLSQVLDSSRLNVFLGND